MNTNNDPDATAPSTDSLRPSSVQAGQALRRRAEERLSERQSGHTPEAGGQRSAEETAQTLHELRVHQIELEMQNEELRRAQAEIEAGRARYFDLYDLAPVGYCTLSEQGLILEANLTAAKLLGTARGALAKRPLSHFIIKDDQDVYYLYRKKLLETGKPQECDLRLVKPDGTNFWSHLTATAAQAEDGAPLCRVVLSDITERKRAERAMQRKEHDLSESQRIAHVGSWRLDVATDQVVWTDELYTMYGFDPSLPPPPYAEHEKLFTPESWERLSTALARTRDTGVAYTLELETVRKDGSHGWMWVRGEADVDSAGKTVGLWGAAQDITERKRAEDALRTSEDKFRSIFASMTEIVVLHELVCDEAGRPVNYRILDCNPAFTQMTGKRRDDAVGQLATEVYGSDTAPYLDEYARVALTGQPCAFITSYAPISKHFDIHVASPGKNMFITVTTDITERKRVENVLRESEERFSTAFQTSPYAITITRAKDGKLIEVNDAFMTMTGFTREEALANSSIGLKLWANMEDREQVVNDLRAGRSVFGRAYPFRMKGDKTFMGSFSARAILLGGEACVLSSIEDITERKRAEECLRESEARFRGYVEHAPYGVFVTDGQGRYVDVNPAATRITGYSAEQLTSMRISDLLVPESLETGLRHHRTLVETGESAGDMAFRRADGSLGHWMVSATRLGPDSYLGFVEDITERKEREERIAIMGRMLDAAPAAITIHNDEGQFLFSNRHNALLHGYESEEQFLGLRLHQLDVPVSADLGSERLRLIAERGEARFEVAHYRKDGSTFPLEVTAKVIEWHGRPAVLSIGIDITERVRAGEALRASESRFKELLMHVPTVAVQGYALDGTVRYWNRASETFYGFTAKEALGQNLIDLIIPPGMRDGVGATIRRMVETGEAIPATEVELMRKDGTLIPVYSSHTLVHLPGREPELFCIDIDLTERKRAEAEQDKLQAQFLRAQKMESVGRLAGGVAHDFNNLLMVIMNYAELCLDAVDPDHPTREWLAEIMAESQRSANLVRQLLAFARKQPVQPKPVDMNEQVGGMLKLLRRMIGERIELTWSPAANLRTVSADPSHIDQVMANLCVNAADAIAGSGRIAIATRNVAMTVEDCSVRPGLVPGAYVLLSVADTGCGMDADTVSHIFEPFFTTKGLGHGTGLGLATVYGIMKQSHGFIYVDSAPGAGTTFSIYLPVIECPETEAAPLANAGPPPGGSETILVVDDERSIRVTTAAHLERWGYTVLMADGPETALALAREHVGAIDLLLSDMVMPGMNGVELRERLLPGRPGLKTIFITGYTTPDFVNPEGKGPDTVRLMKPVPLRDLATAIRSVLGDQRTEKT